MVNFNNYEEILPASVYEAVAKNLKRKNDKIVHQIVNYFYEENGNVDYLLSDEILKDCKENRDSDVEYVYGLMAEHEEKRRKTR